MEKYDGTGGIHFDVSLSEDAVAFGKSTPKTPVYVYCSAHLTAHETGWCSIPAHYKTKLDSTNMADALRECAKRGLKTGSLYGS